VNPHVNRKINDGDGTLLIISWHPGTGTARCAKHSLMQGRHRPIYEAALWSGCTAVRRGGGMFTGCRLPMGPSIGICLSNSRKTQRRALSRPSCHAAVQDGVGSDLHDRALGPVLAAAGAQVDALRNAGWSALHLACTTHEVERGGGGAVARCSRRIAHAPQC
jgi:hypothetical protein